MKVDPQQRGGTDLSVFPNSPVGRQVQWLLSAWIQDEVSQEEAEAHFAPSFSFNRLSTNGSLLSDTARRAWLAQGRAMQPVVKQVEADSWRQLCVLLESRDGRVAWYGFLVEAEAPHRLMLTVGVDAVDPRGKGGSSATMQVAALGRAAHLVDDEPHVIQDEIAAVLLSPEYRCRLPQERRRGPVPLHVVIRARVAEDVVTAAYATGCRQYVILGAGLDSFAYRRGDLEGLRVFEVDLPASQAWKRARLAEVGIAEPAGLTFVPVDFDTESLDDRLGTSGYEVDQPAVFSMLGVSMFIAVEAIEQTLKMIASCPGNHIVMDYATLSLENDPDRLLRAVVGHAGEPFVSLFEPDEMDRLITSCGFEVLQDLSPADATQLYLGGRPDNLSHRGATRFVHAQVFSPQQQ